MVVVDVLINYYYINPAQHNWTTRHEEAVTMIIAHNNAALAQKLPTIGNQLNASHTFQNVRYKSK